MKKVLVILDNDFQVGWLENDTIWVNGEPFGSEVDEVEYYDFEKLKEILHTIKGI